MITLWWKKRSKLEHILIVLLVCSLIVIVSLIISIHIIAQEEDVLDNLLTMQTVKNNELETDEQSAMMNREIVCTTTECVHTASKVLEYMDPNVEPCEDFYHFACGNFIQNTVIPDDRDSMSIISIAKDDILNKLKKIMDRDAGPNESKESLQFRTFYKSCMNEVSIEKKGVQPLLEILETLGGWPVIEDHWDDSKFDWTDSFIRNSNVGLATNDFPRPYFETVPDIYPNGTDRSKINVIMDFRGTVHRNLLYIPNNQHAESFQIEEARLLKAYHNYMIDVAVFLGADRDRATKELQESLDFEYRLTIKILSPKKYSLYKFDRNQTTMRDLISTYPSIPWLDLATKVHPTRQNVTEDDLVSVVDPKSFAEFAKLMEETPKRVLANYAMWRVIYDLIGYVGGKIQEKKLKYLRETHGITRFAPRWQQCMSVSIDNLFPLVEDLYANKYSEDTAEKNIPEIINHIRQEFENTLEKLEWLDAEAKNASLEKLDVMCTIMMTPKRINPNVTNPILNMSEDNYFGNIMKLAALGLFSQRPLHLSSLEINAYYNPFVNCLVLPIGILQNAFFNEERLQYMNYGKIGYIIGHEISHGFDNKNVDFDKHGNLSDWLKNDARKEYLKKIQCIIDQYGNYTDKEVQLTLDGENVSNENIADNSGLKWAFLAYKDWASRNGPELLLPGVNFTQQQMFWISMAQFYCEKNRPESLKRDIIGNKHPPGHFRVIGMLSNMVEFSKDFECPIGSRMNPEVKCNVW